MGTRRLVEHVLTRNLASPGSHVSTHCIRDKCFQIDRRTCSGGDVTVAESDIGPFMDAFVVDVEAGGQVSLCEQPGNTFKQFFVASMRDVSADSLGHMATAATRALRQFYTGEADDHFECIACVATMATGEFLVQLIYPRLVVHAQRALMHRLAFVFQLHDLDVEVQGRILGEPPDRSGRLNPLWERSVKADVYLHGSTDGRGVLVVGSHAKGRCKGSVTATCTRATMNQCVECLGEGFVVHGAAMKAVAFYDGAAKQRTNVAEKFCRALVELTSVRTSLEAHPGWAAPPGCAQVPAPHVDRARGAQLTTRFPNERVLGKKKIESVAVIAMITKCVRRCGEPYRGTHVSEVVDATRANKPRYFVSVLGPGSSFCGHTCTDHADGRIYFEINSQGIQQCCWVCDKYRRKAVQLPDAARTCLKLPIERHGGSSTFTERLETSFLPLLESIVHGTGLAQKKQRR